MAITRYEPWSMLNQLYKEMDQIFHSRLGTSETESQSLSRPDWLPSVDIKEEDNQYILQMDIPVSYTHLTLPTIYSV